jgi:meso-butanediol dehydrogenase / (S,S)-butanediol dehydrogenase / diacetyl reductase
MRQVALVTGAGRGIGGACAKAFAARGWAVAAVGRTRGPAGADGDHWAWVPGDVREPDTSRRAVEHAVERFGRLDAVVGNAGVTLAKTVDDTSPDEVEEVLAVNVKALVYLAQAAHEPLRRTRGTYTVIASNKGLVAQRGSPVYVASKGAAVQLARALALDWAGDGIRVNALCPGLVDTRMLRAFAESSSARDDTWAALQCEQPLGRLARPEECADAVLWLASPAASFVSGVALPIDGGFTAQ